MSMRATVRSLENECKILNFHYCYTPRTLCECFYYYISMSGKMAFCYKQHLEQTGCGLTHLFQSHETKRCFVYRNFSKLRRGRPSLLQMQSCQYKHVVDS